MNQTSALAFQQQSACKTKFAGRELSRPASQEVEMVTSLFLLLLIVLIRRIRVKINIEPQ